MSTLLVGIYLLWNFWFYYKQNWKKEASTPSSSYLNPFQGKQYSSWSGHGVRSLLIYPSVLSCPRWPVLDLFLGLRESHISLTMPFFRTTVTMDTGLSCHLPAPGWWQLLPNFLFHTAKVPLTFTLSALPKFWKTPNSLKSLSVWHN